MSTLSYKNLLFCLFQSLNRKLIYYIFFLLLGTLTAMGCAPEALISEGNFKPIQNLPAIQNHSLSEIEATAEALAKAQISDGSTPGMSVAIARNGEILFARAYGQADVEMSVEASTETVYHIGSLTKQFTAAIIMRLAEKGQISLHDLITKYLPDYPVQGHQVTIRHLLNHTAGIKDISAKNEAEFGQFRLDLSYEALVNWFCKRPFAFSPGEKFDYNNLGYILLGEIIYKVTGLPYAEYVEKELLQPLGLDNTWYADPLRIIPNRAKGYEIKNGKLVNVPYISPKLAGAAGALCSTIDDLIRWTFLLHGGQVVSQESLQQMTAPTVLANGDTIGYGYGLYVQEFNGHRKIFHDGTFGFGSYLAHYPAAGLTIVVLTNSESGRSKAEAMEKALARIILGWQVHDLPTAPANVSRYMRTTTY